jgi:hypothetical protein
MERLAMNVPTNSQGIMAQGIPEPALSQGCSVPPNHHEEESSTVPCFTRTSITGIMIDVKDAALVSKSDTGNHFCSDTDDDSSLDYNSVISSLSSCNSFSGNCDDEATIPIDLNGIVHNRVSPSLSVHGFDMFSPGVIDTFVSIVAPQSKAHPDVSDTAEVIEADSMSVISSLSSIVDAGSFQEQLISLSHREKPAGPSAVLGLPEDLILNVASYLDVISLSQLRLASGRSRLLASKDEAGWKQHCEALWSKRDFVFWEARLLYSSRQAMKAYHLSVYDARHREELRPEELCFDTRTGEGIVWDFRFKETAGVEWTSLDPWWTGGRARKIVFLPDGSVKQIAQISETNGFSLHPPFHDLSRLGLQSGESNSGNHYFLANAEMTWRFVDQPMDLPKRPCGAYLRLTVDGRDVPTYVVSRSPNGNWGFVIENCWGVYSSTPLPGRQILDSPSNPIRRTRMRLRRTRDGPRWLNVDGIETDSEEDDEQSHSQQKSVDASFSMSTRSQWREALLYNYGAAVLPEGEHATVEFDRVWKQSFRQRQLS